MLPAQIRLPELDQLPALTSAELDEIAHETQATLDALLAQDTLAASTVASYASALRYWDAWHRAATGNPLPLLDTPRHPVATATVCAFVAHHTPVSETGRARLAMPDPVRARLQQMGASGVRVASRRKPGRDAATLDVDVPTLATIKHRIAALSSCHRLAGLTPEFAGDATLKQALQALSNRVGREAAGMLRQPKRALDRGLLTAILRDCARDGLRGIHDAALLSVAFNSGGRRRSEMVSMHWPDLEPFTLPEPVNGLRDGYLWTIWKMKGWHRDRADRGAMQAPILGEAASALDRWRDVAFAHGLPQDGRVWYRIVKGPEERWRPSTPAIAADVGSLVKRRVAALGIDPEPFGGHSLRSGAATTFLKEGGALVDASAMLGHSKIETTRAHYDHRDVPVDAVARLASKQK